jgi:Carboxypeptidase regulatory-like domain
MRFHSALFALMNCALAVSAFAQTAQLSGIITDPSGQSVPEAEIQVRNEGTGLIRTTKSTAEGDYTVPALLPGSYEVRVQKSGFKTLARDGIVLQVEQHARLDLTMELGAVEAQVSVSADAPMINTSDASVSTVVDRAFVENLPLNGRSFQALIALTPGAAITPVNADEEGQLSVAGQRSGSNYFTVDGVGANFAASVGLFQGQTSNGGLPALSALGSTASLVSMDALQEFRIETSTYAPEYGRQSGGQVVLVTRSGTNSFHGTAFEYFRNDVLDANNWFANSTGVAKPKERQNDFGGVFGGPIVKNKTFFFFSYEGLRVAQPQLTVNDVPSLAARATAAPNVKAFVDAFPLPNGPITGPGIAQFAGSYTNASTLDATSLRIDHAINSKMTLFGRYNHSPSQLLYPNSADSSVANIARQIDTGTIGLTAILTPSITNDLRFNYSRSTGGQFWAGTSYGGATPPSESSLTAPFQTLAKDWVVIGFANGRNALWLAGLAANNVNRQINFTDSLSVIRGTHQMKFGVDIRRLTPTTVEASAGSEYYWLTAANFESGAAPDIELLAQAPNNVLPLRFYNFSSFAQDTWKATRRLTLTYGVRWDYNPPPVVTAGQQPYILSSVTDLANATLLSGQPLWHADWKNFAPRLGASYLLRDKTQHPTVLRAGFGQFYDLGTSTAGYLDTGQGWYPFSQITYLCLYGSGPSCNGQIPYSGAEPSFTFTKPYPPMRAFDPHLKLPYALEWNIAVEQTLTANQTLSVTYLGSAGRRLLRDDVIKNPNTTLNGLYLTTNESYSNYDALQVQFQRRLSHGLQALVSYTFSHSLDLNSSDVSSAGAGGRTQATAIPTNLYNINQDYGDSSFDIRHTFSAAATYNLPTPKFGNAFVRTVLQNWSLDSTTSARSGTPFNVLYQPSSSAAFVDGFGKPIQLRPDQVTGQPVYISDPNAPGGRRLNLTAFSIPSVLHQGSEGRNNLRGFPLLELDLAARRDFRLTEHLNLQVRADAYNFINHPNFGNPLSNMGTCAQGVTCAPVYGWGTSQALENQSLTATNASYVTSFGSLYQVGGPRSFQLSMKLQF